MPQALRSKLGVAVALLFTAAIALIGTAGMAQTGVSTLVGTIRDSTGATIPSAKVVVVNPETSFRSETTTSQQGDYYVPYLSPGTYRLTVEATGFKHYV